MKVIALPAHPELFPLMVAAPISGFIVTDLLTEVPIQKLFVGVATILPELPGVEVKVIPEPAFGIQSIGNDQLKFVAPGAEALNVIAVPAQPTLAPFIVASPGTTIISTNLLPDVPKPQILEGVTVTKPELIGVVVKLVPVPELGFQSPFVDQLKLVASVAETVNVIGVPAHSELFPLIVASPGSAGVIVT